MRGDVVTYVAIRRSLLFEKTLFDELRDGLRNFRRPFSSGSFADPPMKDALDGVMCIWMPGQVVENFRRRRWKRRAGCAAMPHREPRGFSLFPLFSLFGRERLALWHRFERSAPCLDQLHPRRFIEHKHLFARVHIDRRYARRLEDLRHERPQHLDLETRVEFTNVADNDALPVDRLNVTLQASLHTSSKQEINGVRFGCLGLRSEVRVVLDVVVHSRYADMRPACRVKLGPAHRVNRQPSGAPSHRNAHAYARHPVPEYPCATGGRDTICTCSKGAACPFLEPLGFKEPLRLEFEAESLGEAIGFLLGSAEGFGTAFDCGGDVFGKWTNVAWFWRWDGGYWRESISFTLMPAWSPFGLFFLCGFEFCWERIDSLYFVGAIAVCTSRTWRATIEEDGAVGEAFGTLEDGHCVRFVVGVTARPVHGFAAFPLNPSLAA